MAIISYLSELISYNAVVSMIVASIVLLVFMLSDYYYNNESEQDKELFKQPPPAEDCPICFLLLPSLESGTRYYNCCGKEICSGCCYAPVYDSQGNEVDNQKCPYCRTPWPSSDEEIVRRFKNRMKAGDPVAMCNLGVCYRDGSYGYTQDYTKALELYHRAAELGSTEAYCFVGYAYLHGRGVEVDKKKGIHYWEQGAIGGDVQARYNLGQLELEAGNFDRALKHYMIAIRSGDPESLKDIQSMYSNGDATKEDYMKALQSYQAYLGEVKSVQRDEATAYDEEYRCY